MIEVISNQQQTQAIYTGQVKTEGAYTASLQQQ